MDNPYSSPSHNDHEEMPRLSPAMWFERVIAGLFWGWVWSALVGAGWVGLATVAYGDIGRASEAMMGKAWARFASSAFMVSILASFIGCLVGPLSIGVSRSRVRRPILLSANFGAAFGAVIGTVAAFATEWIAEMYAPRSMLAMWMAIGVSLPVGLLAGWLGGRAVLGRRATASGSVGKTV
jgi:hypothetical protein